MKMHKKLPMSKVLFFTGNRSEFGLLSPLIDLLSDESFEATLMIAGDHHSASQGYSKNEISFINVKIVDLPYDNPHFKNCEKISFLISKLTKYLSANFFDYLVLYGDRYETFAAAICAHQHNIKIVHVEGGDITEGGVHDDSIRHAISKLATFHLPSNSRSAKNLMQLGEEPWRVHVTGLTVSSYIENGNYTKKSNLYTKYSLDERTVIVFTLHPMPSSATDTLKLVNESLKALNELDPNKFKVIITHPNSDPHNELIIDCYQNLHNSHLLIIPSLGRMDFHGLLALNRGGVLNVLCVGNSSSGIKEAGFFNCVSINIGERQKSRLRSGLVFDCEPLSTSILEIIEDIKRNDFYRHQAANIENPYLAGTALKDISKMLLSYAKNNDVLKKKFFTIEQSQ
jgi:UDP-hydrolysing UDP-N-acetyl-D-glucosamine 2-epimerase